MFALEMAAARTTERLTALPATDDPRQALRQSIMATLPLDDARRAEALVWAAYTAVAPYRPRLAAVLTELDRQVRVDLMRQLDFGYFQDPVAVADALIATADGLAQRMLYDPARTQAFLNSLDLILDRLITMPQTAPSATRGLPIS